MKQIWLFLGILILSTQAGAQDYIPIPGSPARHTPITVYSQSQGCAAQDQVPESYFFEGVPEELLKSYLIKIEWTPTLKGRWKRSDPKTWVWTRTTKTKPLQRYQAKIFLQKRGLNHPSGHDPIVHEFNNTLTFCLLDMEAMDGNFVRIKFDASLEMEGKDLAPFVTFSIAGKAKRVRWTTIQGFSQAAAELELLDSELSNTLDVTIPKTIKFGGQTIQLPKAYFPRFDLLSLEEHRKAARVRVPAAELNTKKGVKETCAREFDLIDMADPMTCYYHGDAFKGGNRPEAMAMLTAAQCKKGRPVIDRYVQCIGLGAFEYNLLWDE